MVNVKIILRERVKSKSLRRKYISSVETNNEGYKKVINEEGKNVYGRNNVLSINLEL